MELNNVKQYMDFFSSRLENSRGKREAKKITQLVFQKLLDMSKSELVLSENDWLEDADKKEVNSMLNKLMKARRMMRKAGRLRQVRRMKR